MPDDEKIGRPRRYRLAPVPGLANAEAAWLVAGLDELLERHFDLIADQPAAVLDYRPAGWPRCIATVTAHMIWAEAFWLTRATRSPMPDELEAELPRAEQGPPSAFTCGQLDALARRVRRDVTKALLAGQADIDAEVAGASPVISIRGVLLHLVWHWTYHSGQCGLLHGLAGGGEYRWTFDERIVGR